MDYKDTIILPKTKFPMKASLAMKEPEWLKFWEENKIYEKMLEATKDSKSFIFHDGPPYANGNIHHGHILNKVLKDIVVKYRSMKGYHVPFIPGWDCHGLPIELNAERELGKPSDDADKLSIRRRCRDFALKWSNKQMDDFKRLGAFALWDSPYRTLDKDYEAQVVKQLASIVEKNMIYRGHKPIYWCADCVTALAEAEVEYQNHKSPSIYVSYRVKDTKQFADLFKLNPDDIKKISVVIWTTTPWTLPASLVIAVNPNFEYRAFEADGDFFIMATQMAEKSFADCEIQAKPVGIPVKGSALEKIICLHPFLDREIPILCADYVTLEAGTGCVHTAPGHGQDDYVLCSKHGIDVYAPVDEKGKFDYGDGVGGTKDGDGFGDGDRMWEGKTVWDANPLIVKHLQEKGALLNPAGQTLEHQYPACWRCKKPIIFRATPQWFISMNKNNLREKSMEQIEKVHWIPHWGRERIMGMIENRPDWCISRQRLWGVPLPFFFCEKCKEPLVDAAVIRHIADIFGKKGSDAWFEMSAKELLPDGMVCKSCDCKDFLKEENIVDVWFESGISWDAICRTRLGLDVPVDLYLEGADQHRGWFHTSLLTATATIDIAPYKTVLTHGFICNEKGEILSKSQKNFVPPKKTIDQQGAEIFRLWVSYEDYRSDIAFSPAIIRSLTDSYRKIRNTFRFMLGNLKDFNPQNAVPLENILMLDKWMLLRFSAYLKKLDSSYDEYKFHHIFHQTIDLVITELSQFYCDIIKDRLYCEHKDGLSRRSAQTVLYILTRDMARVLAPVLSFTAEEVWQHLPQSSKKQESVFLAEFPSQNLIKPDDAIVEKIKTLRDIRQNVTKNLEDLRKDGKIGNALGAHVELTASDNTYTLLNQTGEEELADFFLVSSVTLNKGGDELEISAKPVDYVKCPRCWRHRQDVGADSNYPDLCSRCAGVVNKMQKDEKSIGNL